ncbi:hypothetical protein P5673_002753 [Acropora cervicornis]|uniref:Uncharacterized protein n=1 Tax=Acropora cervicornis TaxID=6130 RepID=A0AAD9R3L5_ACRCE|nr:hypothetical protein P5673_002753 [Acropora cervicornis]
MSWISLSLIFGLIHAVGAQSLETTSSTACVSDSIALPGNDPSRLVKRSWWKARYQDGPWIEIGHCVKTKGCINSTTVLPDGTRAWIGINESLIVERSSDQRNATAQFQYRRASENSLEKEVIQLPSPFQKQQQKFPA